MKALPRLSSNQTFKCSPFHRLTANKHCSTLKAKTGVTHANTYIPLGRAARLINAINSFTGHTHYTGLLDVCDEHSSRSLWVCSLISSNCPSFVFELSYVMCNLGPHSFGSGDSPEIPLRGASKNIGKPHRAQEERSTALSLKSQRPTNPHNERKKKRV